MLRRGGTSERFPSDFSFPFGRKPTLAIVFSLLCSASHIWPFRSIYSWSVRRNGKHTCKHLALGAVVFKMSYWKFTSAAWFFPVALWHSGIPKNSSNCYFEPANVEDAFVFLFKVVSSFIHFFLVSWNVVWLYTETHGGLRERCFCDVFRPSRESSMGTMSTILTFHNMGVFGSSAFGLFAT